MPFQGINITNTDYIPQYAGMPLEAMERVGDELQTRHYDNIAKARQIELYGLQQLAETPSDADKRYIQGQLQGVQGAIQEMAKSGAENATGRIGALVTSFMGDEGLNRMKRNAQQYRTEQEALAKLGESGVYNKKLREKYLTEGTVGQDGNFFDYMSSAQERLNYDKKADEIFDPLQANVYQTDLEADLKTSLGAWGINKVVPGVSGDLSKLPAKFKTMAIKRLSREKIEDFAENQGGWESYKKSSEYAQQKNILDMDDKEIKDNFMSRGYAKVYEQITKDWESNPLLGMIGKGSGDDSVNPYSATVNMPNMQVPKVDFGVNPDDFDFRKRGTPDPLGASKRQKEYSTSGSLGMESIMKHEDGYANKSPEEWKAFSKLANEIASINGIPGFDELTPDSNREKVEEARQLVTEYQNFVNSRIQEPKKLTGGWDRLDQEGRSRSQDVTEDFVKHITSASIFDPVEGKLVPVQDKSGKGFSKRFLELTGAKDVEDLTITGEIDPKNHYTVAANNPNLADAYILQIRDKDDPDIFTEVIATNPVNKFQSNKPIKVAVNKAYTTFNLKPGIEQEVEILGKKIKGKELFGRQIEQYFSNLSKEDQQTFLQIQATAGDGFMPILAEVPGLAEPTLFNGADDLVDYLKTLK